VDSAL